MTSLTRVPLPATLRSDLAQCGKGVDLESSLGFAHFVDVEN